MIGITSHHKMMESKNKIKEISFDCLYKGNINELVKGKKKSILFEYNMKSLKMF